MKRTFQLVSVAVFKSMAITTLNARHGYHTTLNDGIFRKKLLLAQFRRVWESARSRHLHLWGVRWAEHLVNCITVNLENHNIDGVHNSRPRKLHYGEPLDLQHRLGSHQSPKIGTEKTHTFMLQKAVALIETEPDPVTYTLYVSYIDVSCVSLSRSMSGPRTSFTLNLLFVFSSSWPQRPCRVPSTNT